MKTFDTFEQVDGMAGCMKKPIVVRECGRVYIQNQQDGVMTLTQDLLQHFGVE